jgi:hypothetical protein
MILSAVINFYISDPIKATFGVDDSKAFISNQASEIFRTVCTKFVFIS